MFTKDQLKAINTEGNNILVSAGAGAGKTAVLTARVLRKINEGTHINNLLILTFTKAAASEMKERIRCELLNNKLYDELNLLDSSYITTFDSFSLSVVKKYHTRLNITNKINITEEVVINIIKKKILEEIFNENYLSPKTKFIKLIEDFCLKNDKELQEYILNIYKKLELKYDIDDYLNNYLSDYDKNINIFINEYLELLKEKQNTIKNLVLELPNYFDNDYVSKVEEDLSELLNASTYDEFKKCFDRKIGTTKPRGSDYEQTCIKESIYNKVKDIKNLCIYEDSNEIKNNLLSTKDNLEVIVEILKEFNKRLSKYKEINNIYGYSDIARLSIKLVKENKDIKDELTSSFNEILLDEYQDTSDIQELFISLISNNNLYMVGDIKQSIYRFRNTNPYLFREKYENYDGKNGIKIDLVKNFRSREEVLNNINLIFNKVMDQKCGGADYKDSHQLVFGNNMYQETNQNNNIEIITYNDKLDSITKDEQEAYIIANDIKTKIDNNFQVLDKDTKCLRNVDYSDFVILLDRKKNFTLYKKIFEYLNIPLTILEEESLKDNEDIEIIRNLLRLLICIKEDRLDLEFKYTYMSICRSYLYKLSDDEIYKIFINDNFKDTSLYKKLLELTTNIDSMNLSNYLLYVLDELNYEEKLLTKTNIKSYRMRLEYIYNLCRSYEKLGNTIYDFIDYLEEVFENDYDLKFNVNTDNSNSVKIMTIHKSKGLEYPICYYASLYSKFNKTEATDKILFDSKYGIILPEVNKYYKDTILKILYKENLSSEEISERIRLFYVALTRAKEKMIMVIPKEDEDKMTIYEKDKYNSYLNVIRSIYNDLNKFEIESNILANKDYLTSSKIVNNLSKTDKKLNVEELVIDVEEILEKHYSKDELHLVERSEKELLELGTKVHEILEEIDFNDYNLDLYNIDTQVKNKINSFINSSLMQDKLNLNMYKEYEFLYEDDNSLSHGIIDLLIEDKDMMYIIDYKLKNIDDPNYDNQLNGYRKYIEELTKKETKCYLYSIINENYREVL